MHTNSSYVRTLASTGYGMNSKHDLLTGRTKEFVYYGLWLEIFVGGF